MAESRQGVAAPLVDRDEEHIAMGRHALTLVDGALLRRTPTESGEWRRSGSAHGRATETRPGADQQSADLVPDPSPRRATTRGDPGWDHAQVCYARHPRVHGCRLPTGPVSLPGLWADQEVAAVLLTHPLAQPHLQHSDSSCDLDWIEIHPAAASIGLI
jgi:hypothetical protein